METRHGVQRSLRSGGAALSRAPLQHGRSKTVPAKQLGNTKTRARANRGESGRVNNADKKSNQTNVNRDSSGVAPVKATEEDSSKAVNSESFKSASSSSSSSSSASSCRRSRLRGQSLGLPVHGRPLMNLKSKVDWSQNVEESPESSPPPSPTQTQPDSSLPSESGGGSTKSRRTSKMLDSSGSQAAKSANGAGGQVERLKSQRLLIAGRTRSNSPSNPPPAGQTRASSAGAASSPGSKQKVSEQSAKSTPSQRLRPGSSDAATKASTGSRLRGTTPEVATKSGARRSATGTSTRAAASLKQEDGAEPGKEEQEARAPNEPVDKQVKDLRAAQQGRVLRTSSRSPATRTRSSTPQGNSINTAVKKEDVKKPKPEAVTAADTEQIANPPDVSTDGDEETEGDAVGVMKPRYCSSSPESDHNYAKPDLVAKAFSAKVPPVEPAGCSPSGASSASARSSGSDGHGCENSQVDVEGLGARRALRGSTQSRMVTRKASHSHRTVESVTKSCQGEGVTSKDSRSAKEAESGKTKSAKHKMSRTGQSCIEPLVSTGEKDTVATVSQIDKETSGKCLSQGRVSKKSSTDRKVYSNSVLRVIKKALRESKIKKQTSRTADGTSETHLPKAQPESSCESVDDDKLSHPEGTKVQQFLHAERKVLDRNLFADFNRDAPSGVPESERKVEILAAEIDDDSAESTANNCDNIPDTGPAHKTRKVVNDRHLHTKNAESVESTSSGTTDESTHLESCQIIHNRPTDPAHTSTSECRAQTPRNQAIECDIGVGDNDDDDASERKLAPTALFEKGSKAGGRRETQHKGNDLDTDKTQGCRKNLRSSRLKSASETSSSGRNKSGGQRKPDVEVAWPVSEQIAEKVKLRRAGILGFRCTHDNTFVPSSGPQGERCDLGPDQVASTGSGGEKVVGEMVPGTRKLRGHKADTDAEPSSVSPVDRGSQCRGVQEKTDKSVSQGPEEPDGAEVVEGADEDDNSSTERKTRGRVKAVLRGKDQDAAPGRLRRGSSQRKPMEPPQVPSPVSSENAPEKECVASAATGKKVSNQSDGPETSVSERPAGEVPKRPSTRSSVIKKEATKSEASPAKVEEVAAESNAEKTASPSEDVLNVPEEPQESKDIEDTGSDSTSKIREEKVSVEGQAAEIEYPVQDTGRRKTRGRGARRKATSTAEKSVISDNEESKTTAEKVREEVESQDGNGSGKIDNTLEADESKDSVKEVCRNEEESQVPFDSEESTISKASPVEASAVETQVECEKPTATPPVQQVPDQVRRRSRGRPKRTRSGAESEAKTEDDEPKESPCPEQASSGVAEVEHVPSNSTDEGSQQVEQPVDERQECKSSSEQQDGEEARSSDVQDKSTETESSQDDKETLADRDLSAGDPSSCGGASSVGDSMDQKKRRGRPRKQTQPTDGPQPQEIEDDKSPDEKKESPKSGLVTRWKIPPPSPIRTRRLSREVTSTSRAPENSTLQTTSQCQQPLSEELGNSSEAKELPKLSTPDSTTISDDKDNASNDKEDKTPPTGVSIPQDRAPSVALRQPRTKEEVATLPLSKEDKQKDPELPLGSGKLVVEELKSADGVSPGENQSDPVQLPLSPSDKMVDNSSSKQLPEQSTNEAVGTKVDELQVPFHDTDEAEVLATKAQAEDLSVGGTPVKDEPFQLYLETESNPSDDEKVIPPEEAEVASSAEQPEITDKQVEDAAKTGNECTSDAGDTEKTTSPSTVSTDRAHSDVPTPPQEVQSEPKPVDKVGHAQSSMTPESPSKSEWCAKKVTEGMKIVLKLKRKGSSERGDTSAPGTPTSAAVDVKPKFSATAISLKDSSPDVIRKAESIPKGSGSKSIISSPAPDTATQQQASPAVSQTTPSSEDLSRKRKRRRNELEMLNVTERSYHKKHRMQLQGVGEGSLSAYGDNTDSEVSGFTSDSGSVVTVSNHTASMAGTEKESVAKTGEEQLEVPQVKVEMDVAEPPALESVEPTAEKMEEVSSAASVTSEDSQQKVEKLVIKRRVPSPTKMKTRGKQNRLWYLFAKQSKPNKELVMPQDDSEFSPTPQGTVEELQSLCKPCSVHVVDLIKCLDMLSGEQGSDPTGHLTDVDKPEDLSLPKASPDSHSSPLDRQAGMEEQTGTKRKLEGASTDENALESRTVTIPWPKEDSNTPSAKRPKLEAGSEYEKQFLSFIMPKASSQTDSSLPESAGNTEAPRPAAPKPVLCRASVTARKTMKSAKRPAGILGVQKVGAGGPRGEGRGLHTDKSPPSAISGGGQGARFACRHCSFVCGVRSVMLEHVYIHTDVIPYACGHCNEEYGSRNGVIIHTKREHPGLAHDVVKNTEMCEEDYYVTYDTNKRTFSSAAGTCTAAAESLQVSSQNVDTSSSKGKSVSLLNPAVLTAQVAAAKAGALPVTTASPVQLVVTTSRPVSTAPIVNVVAQIDSTSHIQSETTGASRNVKEYSGNSNGAAIADGTKKDKSKIPRRPRIPSLVNVDPNQPYYQCRHCTFANNSLTSIESHVQVNHQGEQCYQCPHCELSFFKNITAVERHYSKYHPGEPLHYQLQADFYDVHQKEADRNKQLQTSMAGPQNRGQSPLHVIVSSDGVTLLSAAEVSPAGGSSPKALTSHPPTVRGHLSPSPAHSRPQPVLSPSYPQHQRPTPPPAHSGSPALSPHYPVSTKGVVGSQAKASSRIILKVPTISPPQRASSQMQVSPSSSTHSGTTDRSSPPQYGALPGSSSNNSSSSHAATHTDEPGEVLNLTNKAKPSDTLSPPILEKEIDLSSRKSQEPTEEMPSTDGETENVEESEPVQAVVAESEEAAEGETSMMETESVNAAEQSPPPLMIMNVMSLAGQPNIDDMDGEENSGQGEDHQHQPSEEEEEERGEEDQRKDEQEAEEWKMEEGEAEVFSCKYCSSKFDNLSEMVGHISEVHQVPYWYACPYCPYGCSWGKMLEHIGCAHPDRSSKVPVTIIDEEKYFTRSPVNGSQDSTEAGGQGSLLPSTENEEELDIECEAAREDSTGKEASSGQESATPNKEPQTNDDCETTAKAAQKSEKDTSAVPVEQKSTSEKGCSTDDMLPAKEPPVPSRVVHLDDDDVVIVAEHRKQRPVGQIRPTMVRTPSTVQPGFRRLAPGNSTGASFAHTPPTSRHGPPSPITISPTKPHTASTPPQKQPPGAVSELDMDCETILDSRQPSTNEPSDDSDDVIITETQSSVITMSSSTDEQPLDLHMKRESGRAKEPYVIDLDCDEPTDLRVTDRSTIFTDEPQDLSFAKCSHTHKTSRSDNSSPTVMSCSRPSAAAVKPTRKSEPSSVPAPPPAHQSVSRHQAPPLVIEPIPSPPQGVRSCTRALSDPILIAPLPHPQHTKSSQGKAAKSISSQPQPAHSQHQRSSSSAAKQESPGRSDKQSRLSVLSAKVGAPSLHQGRPKTGTTKNMPPLIQVAPQIEEGGTKTAPRQPPPLIRLGSGQAAQAKTSSSIIQPSASTRFSQSALTSLEILTKRGVDGSPHAPPPLQKSRADEQIARGYNGMDEEATRRAFSVFNLKPPPARLGVRPNRPPLPTQQAGPLVQTPVLPAGPTGINKWRQFQSQNRPSVRPQTAQPPGYRPGMLPGSLGMAAAAFQHAHNRRGTHPIPISSSNSQQPGLHPRQSASVVLPQMSAATAAAAAASFLQRPPLAAPPQPMVSTYQGSANKAPQAILCPYCAFKAEDPDTIHNHILTHAPNIQWSCPYCPLPNRMSKSTVTKHIQNCHPHSNVVYIPYGVPLDM